MEALSKIEIMELAVEEVAAVSGGLRANNVREDQASHVTVSVSPLARPEVAGAHGLFCRAYMPIYM